MCSIYTNYTECNSFRCRCKGQRGPEFLRVSCSHCRRQETHRALLDLEVLKQLERRCSSGWCFCTGGSTTSCMKPNAPVSVGGVSGDFGSPFPVVVGRLTLFLPWCGSRGRCPLHIPPCWGPWSSSHSRRCSSSSKLSGCCPCTRYSHSLLLVQCPTTAAPPHSRALRRAVSGQGGAQNAALWGATAQGGAEGSLPSATGPVQVQKSKLQLLWEGFSPTKLSPTIL